jgi:prepilin-type N-terminal cleavage/methylation domain-containing protein
MIPSQAGSSADAAIASDQHGVSLIEVLVALVILSIALSALAGLSYEVARRSFDSAIESYGIGVATAQLGRLAVLDYDSLAAQAGCVDVDDDYFPHERCISVSDVSTKVLEVTLIITPDVAFSDADTVQFQRSKPKRYNPF